MKNSYQNESSKKKQFYLSTVEKYELENYVSRNRYSKEIELHKLHFHTPAKEKATSYLPLDLKLLEEHYRFPMGMLKKFLQRMLPPT